MEYSVIIFGCSITILCVSGLAIIGINAMLNNSQDIAKYKLNHGLWRFETAESTASWKTEKSWAWRKLFFAGLMISTVFASIFSRVIPPKSLLGLAVGFFVVWTVFIFYYWFSVVVPLLSEPVDKPVPVESPDESDGTKQLGWKYKAKDKSTDNRLPVTIVTGYLGSGKTTLVKGILNNTTGMKVLVVENEIGEEGIDHELLLQHSAPEEIILMNNGCVCCTVRSDLLKTFHKMFNNESFSRLDWVVIETTGLADPAPLIQSLFMDTECKSRLRMDSVITVVDSKHIHNHLSAKPTKKNTSSSGAGTTSSSSAHGGVSEAVLQISFADRIILNKIDLVSPEDLTVLMKIIGGINANASMIACERSKVPVDELLNIRAFDPARNKALLQLSENNSVIRDQPILIQRDAQGKILKKKVKVDFGESSANSTASKGIVTVSLTTTNPLDLYAFNKWISTLLQEKGGDIYRMKGILNMHGYDEQFVAHGIHMIFEGQKGPGKWGEGVERRSKLVFIGLKLKSDDLEAQFMKCVHKK